MGQKVQPNRMRMGMYPERTSFSKWYAKKPFYADLLIQDKKIREFFTSRYKAAVINRILIDRPGDMINVRIGVRGLVLSLVRKVVISQL